MPIPCCTYAQLRERAFALADTGLYDDWDDIAAAVEAEDCLGAIERLSGRSDDEAHAVRTLPVGAERERLTSAKLLRR